MSSTMDKGRQVRDETPSEHVARTGSDFQSVEKSLPHAMGAPFSIPIFDKLSSWLGLHNPMARLLNPNTEEVWILDNTAYRPVHAYPHSEQPWQAEYVVACFKKNAGKDVSDAVANIADKIGLGSQGEDKASCEKTISERLQLFVATIAPARTVDVRLPGVGTKRLGPGGRSAVSEQIVTGLGEHKDGERVSVEAIPTEIAPYGRATTHFAAPEGWMVISGISPFLGYSIRAPQLMDADIDDSIKITLTCSPIGILRSTFVSEPEPIAGMPPLYKHIHSLLSPTWFYLSASPYNLYPFLLPFLRTHYPSGTTLLREASWQDISRFLTSLTAGTEAYKVAEMVKLHTMLPKRKVLCVGDSTQSDPEAYGSLTSSTPSPPPPPTPNPQTKTKANPPSPTSEVYRRFSSSTSPKPQKRWIQKIFIRKVTGVEGMDEATKNAPERFEKAFRGVPRDVWRVFEDPGELYEVVGCLN
ncbi:hypothetical protein G7Y79_00016g040300 [Physcia stellaris]|nr:hypothetical protein G7Y79_00016g040300 [Physcia stellaris]